MESPSKAVLTSNSQLSEEPSLSEHVEKEPPASHAWDWLKSLYALFPVPTYGHLFLPGLV